MSEKHELVNGDGYDLPVRNWAGMSVRLSPDQWRVVKRTAYDERISVQKLIAHAVEAAILERGLDWPIQTISRKKAGRPRKVRINADV